MLEQRAGDMDRSLSGFRELDREVATLNAGVKALGSSLDELRGAMGELASDFEAEKERRADERRGAEKEKRANRLTLAVAAIGLLGTFASSVLAVLMT